ncbi:MAG: TIR domain-containing protein [Bdellovibrionales bacterium]|nr:TIR domain-containing protein [Bdellovibrionales bacterium]
MQDVAFALNLDPAKFFYVVQHADDGSYYREFVIPKKRGGVRSISAPQKGLALAQTRFYELLLEKYKPKPFVKGYVKGESFLTNAKYHEKQKWILNIDIKDFYPSITFARVYGLFLSPYFGFNRRVSAILARITTYRNELPQGARTSPIIANIIASNLDKKLVSLAADLKLKYSRYADDITFSSSQRRIPAGLVKGWEPSFGDREIKLGAALLEAFNGAGFRVNDAKTRLLFSYERQEVTGLVVNQQANVWRKDISRLRMIIHSARKHGPREAASIWVGKNASEEEFWQFLCGWLAYVAQVRGQSDPVVAKLCKLAVIAGLKGPKWIDRSADMVREFDVFLSHASEDKPRVRLLYEKLVEVGVTVFFDEDSIAWGDSIPEKINHGLLKSNFFIPFLSKRFSEKGWTNKELNSAISMNISRKGRILPIIDGHFSVEENYPLLNETLYKKWPIEVELQAKFISTTADEILKKVVAEKLKKHDLG